tara:strand:+ start:4959 stop:5270 length:312 start_codon:yes stop_codon:yes gene_type:complete
MGKKILLICIMSYTITAYTKRQAKRLGVIVKPSTRKGKKIDVFSKDGKKLASIGALGMGDFPTFTKTKGKEFALKRQKAYKSRHQKTRTKVGTPSYYADQLLW